jgi:low affinity Fe/Cu permease
MGHWFAKVSGRVAELAGHFLTFVVMLSIVIVWAATGPFFGFSENWQLVINTGTTNITFLMVFLIQNTQNRDAKAVHLKLDELIRSISEADNEMMSAEDDTDEELVKLKEKYHKLSKEHAELQGTLERLKSASAEDISTN